MDPLEAAVIALVEGLEPEEVAERAVGEWEVSRENARGLVREAESRLAAWAAGPRGNLLVKAVEEAEERYDEAGRIEDLFKSSQERRHWFNIRCNLLGLYDRAAAEAGTGDEAEQEVAGVRAQLLPLGLGPEDLPTIELARLAVAEVMRLRGREERDGNSG